jgi:hypothetical protein
MKKFFQKIFGFDKDDHDFKKGKFIITTTLLLLFIAASFYVMIRGCEDKGKKKKPNVTARIFIQADFI